MSGGLVSMNLQQIIREVIITSCRGNKFDLDLRNLDATERASWTVDIVIFSWSLTIRRYCTISKGRGRGSMEC
jgi:hypothetical protein